MKAKQLEDKWTLRFMNLAKEISSWSKDPSSKVGAIIVDDDRRILSTGYNGFPSGISDDNRLQNREEKYPLVIHAEMNALLSALNNGVSVRNSTLFVYNLPICSDCCKSIIQAGIKKVVIMKADESNRWYDNWVRSKSYFQEAGIEIEEL